MGPKSSPRLPNTTAPHPAGGVIQPRLRHPLPKGEGRWARPGRWNALSTRETEQTGSLMESNESQALASPIAMAAELPESDKARRNPQPFPARPPAPLPPAAGGRARSALGRVNHCKNKEMKAPPIGEPWAASSPAWGRGGEGAARAELPRRARGAPLLLAGWEPRPTIPRRRRPHNLAPPEAPEEAGGGGQAVYPGPAATTPRNRSTKPPAFSRAIRKRLELRKKWLVLRNKTPAKLKLVNM